MKKVNLSQAIKSIHFPPRNIVGFLVPIWIVSWYFIDKVGQDDSLKVIIFVIAILLQIAVIVNSTRTHKARRPLFWSAYDVVTGNGHLPLRVVAVQTVVMLIIALGFNVFGLQKIGGLPSSFIARFVEVDLYWTIVNFLGMSDSSIVAAGYSKFLTVLSAITGISFWGMYISILINKYAEIQEARKHDAPDEYLSEVLYNEIHKSQLANPVLEMPTARNGTDKSDNLNHSTNNQASSVISTNNRGFRLVLLAIGGVILVWISVLLFLLHPPRPKV